MRNSLLSSNIYEYLVFKITATLKSENSCLSCFAK